MLRFQYNEWLKSGITKWGIFSAKSGYFYYAIHNQFFVGLPGFCNEPPYVPSLLVEFRKRFDDETLGEINEMIIDYNRPNDPGPGAERMLRKKRLRRRKTAGQLFWMQYVPNKTSVIPRMLTF